MNSRIFHNLANFRFTSIGCIVESGSRHLDCTTITSITTRVEANFQVERISRFEKRQHIFTRARPGWPRRHLVGAK